MIRVKSHIAAMAKYQPPWTGLDRSGYLRLDLNENTLDPPEHVKAAIKAYIDDNRIQMYPEYERFMEKLSRYAGMPKEQIILSNGSDHAIELLLRAFLSPGDTMLVAQPEFPIFSQVAGVMNAKVKGVSFRQDMAFPFEEFMEALTPEVDLVVLINPNNPTGTPLELARIEQILEKCPDKPVLLDEAYYEYTGATGLGLIEKHPNLMVTRTFSKAFAMAGLRLGYVIAHPEIVAELYKIRGPFDVNSVALVAAEAQLDAPELWRAYIKETMTRSKPYLEEFFRENNVEFHSSAAHFLLVKPENRDEACAFLKERGILVRPMFAKLIEKTFRMCVGSLQQTQQFAECYEKYLQECKS